MRPTLICVFSVTMLVVVPPSPKIALFAEVEAMFAQSCASEVVYQSPALVPQLPLPSVPPESAIARIPRVVGLGLRGGRKR